MIHAVYLASGNARRFGENKLLYPLHGKALYLFGLETLISALSEYKESALTVVSQYDEIISYAEKTGIHAVYSPESVHGLSFSIRAAVKSLGILGADDYILFMVADQPFLKKDTLIRLMAAVENKPMAVCVSYGETQGNPTVFSAELAPDLCDLQGDQGGRAVLRRLGIKCVCIQCSEERELFDIDTIEQARKAGSY